MCKICLKYNTSNVLDLSHLIGLNFNYFGTDDLDDIYNRWKYLFEEVYTNSDSSSSYFSCSLNKSYGGYYFKNNNSTNPRKTIPVSSPKLVKYRGYVFIECIDDKYPNRPAYFMLYRDQPNRRQTDV